MSQRTPSLDRSLRCLRSIRNRICGPRHTTRMLRRRGNMRLLVVACIAALLMALVQSTTTSGLAQAQQPLQTVVHAASQKWAGQRGGGLMMMPVSLSAPSAATMSGEEQVIIRPLVVRSPVVRAVVPRRARVIMFAKGDPTIPLGVLTMTQESPTSPVLIDGRVVGMLPGLHGIHVHEFGDLSKGCDAAGEHFNPTNTVHGGPNDPVRHVGDLGNVYADAQGEALVRKADRVISLFEGTNSVAGLSVVVHATPDDLGRGNTAASLRDGSSRGRIACGVILPSSRYTLEPDLPEPEPFWAS